MALKFKPPVIESNPLSCWDESAGPSDKPISKRPLGTKGEYEQRILEVTEDWLRRRDEGGAKGALIYWLFALVKHRMGLDPGVPGSVLQQDVFDALDEILDKYQKVMERLQEAN